MQILLTTFDQCLIECYRITGYVFVDFLIGTFILAAFAVVIGEIAISLVFLTVRKHVEKGAGEMIRFQDLSLEALKAGDKATFRSCNKLANDAFGKTFFMQVALSAAFLWPAAFALAWMQTRFSDIEFPVLFTNYSVGSVCLFVALYAAAFLLFKRIKYKIPYFRRIKEILDASTRGHAEPKRFTTLGRAEDLFETEKAGQRTGE